jgi:hypothetical protein
VRVRLSPVRVPEPPGSGRRESSPACDRRATAWRTLRAAAGCQDVAACSTAHADRRAEPPPVNLARADQMREQMPQPVHVRQPVQAPATGLSEVCDKKTVKLRDSALDRTLTQQRPHDVVQAQDTAAEIEVQKQ